jgi:hypothetical protein
MTTCFVAVNSSKYVAQNTVVLSIANDCMARYTSRVYVDKILITNNECKLVGIVLVGDERP